MESRLNLELHDELVASLALDNSERARVVKAATQFFGRRYGMTLNLAEDTIDCSTLVSQSFWEGAGILVPFIAESQRLAWVGASIQSCNELELGDTVFKYSSALAAPDGKHNHVALYCGKIFGEQFVLESSSRANGVTLTSLKDFVPEGGYRRFCITPERVLSADSNAWLNLTTSRIHKLDRLGAKRDGRTQNAAFRISLRPGDQLVCPPKFRLAKPPTFQNGNIEFLAVDSEARWQITGFLSDSFKHLTEESDTAAFIATKSVTVDIAHLEANKAHRPGEETGHALFFVRALELYSLNWVYLVSANPTESPVQYLQPAAAA